MLRRLAPTADTEGNQTWKKVERITLNVERYFEWTGSTSTMKKYYYAGATRVVMPPKFTAGDSTGTSTINYLLGDHRGSQAITANSSGVTHSLCSVQESAEVRYYPWGTERYTSGTTPTTFKYTGQSEESGIGLYFYNSRFYDPSLARFIQADTVIPGAGNPQAYDRYAYTLNNPLRYTDPSGHDYCDSIHADPEECKEIDKNGDGKTDKPEPSFTTEHSDYPKTMPYSGAEIWKLYNLMLSDTNGWWYINGEFDFTMFCGLLLIHEGAGDPIYMNLDAIAAAQRLYVGGWTDPYSPNGYSIVGTCNYWAAFSQSAHYLVDKYIRGNNNISGYTGYGDWGIEDKEGTMATAKELGTIMLFSQTNPRRNDALSDYGNDQALVEKLLSTDIQPDHYYPGGNQGIYYYTQDGFGVWYSVNGYNQWK